MGQKIHWASTLKNTFIFEISTLQFVLLQSFFQNKKKIEFETQNALFGYFQLKFEKKTFAIFDDSTVEFCKMQYFAQNKKSSSLDTKGACFNIPGL